MYLSLLIIGLRLSRGGLCPFGPGNGMKSNAVKLTPQESTDYFLFNVEALDIKLAIKFNFISCPNP